MDIININYELLSGSEASLSRYISMVNSIPMLSREEEEFLTNDYYTNKTKKSAEKLILSHLRLVVSTARNFANYKLSMMDLISEGNYGLIKAVQKFDPKKGVNFASYAIWWIKSAIQEYLMKSWSIVKLGTSSLHRKLLLGKSESREMIQQDASIDENLENQLSVSPDYEGDLDKEASIKNLSYAIESLSPREREIINARYINDIKKTLDEISCEMKISKERVRQISNQALKKMKKILETKKILAY